MSNRFEAWSRTIDDLQPEVGWRKVMVPLDELQSACCQALPVVTGRLYDSSLCTLKSGAVAFGGPNMPRHDGPVHPVIVLPTFSGICIEDVCEVEQVPIDDEGRVPFAGALVVIAMLFYELIWDAYGTDDSPDITGCYLEEYGHWFLRGERSGRDFAIIPFPDVQDRAFDAAGLSNRVVASDGLEGDER